MKAWLINNIKSGDFTETTSVVAAQRELLNAFPSVLMKDKKLQEMFARIPIMPLGEVNAIGHLRISCRETAEMDPDKNKELRESLKELLQEIEFYEGNHDKQFIGALLRSRVKYILYQSGEMNNI